MAYSSRFSSLVVSRSLTTSVWVFLSSFPVSTASLSIFLVALTIMGYGYN